MRRREFITGLGGAAVAWSLTARAQQPKVPVVGLLGGVSFEGPYAISVAAIRQGLQEAGFVEGQNLAIEYRNAERPVRATAGARDRSSSKAGGGDRRDRSFDAGPGRHGSYLACSDRICDGIGCSRSQIGQPPQQQRCQPDGHELRRRGPRIQAPGIAARTEARRKLGRLSRQLTLVGDLRNPMWKA